MFRGIVKSKQTEDISILVQMDNHSWNYLCECGDASDLTVKEIQQVNAVFISHTHIDHFVNFDAVIRHQIGIQRRVIICGPKGIAQQVQAKLRSYTWNLIQAGAIIYEIREVISEQEILVYEIEPPIWELRELPKRKGNILLEEKNFCVSGILLDHKTPTLAYKFEQKETIKIDLKSSGMRGGQWVKKLKDAFEAEDENLLLEIDRESHRAGDLFHLLTIQKGDTLGVIMDHAANEENHSKIRQHFEDCRQVFVESFYKNEDKIQAEANYHSYAAMSGRVMREARVKEAVPVHFSRKYKQDEIDVLLAEFRAEFLK
jgi:ribonuclease Z